MMKRTALLFLSFLVFNSIYAQRDRVLLPTGIENKDYTEENGFTWTKVINHSKRDRNNDRDRNNEGVKIGEKQIIPNDCYGIECLYVPEVNQNFFLVDYASSYKKGLYDVDGNVIIPPNCYSIKFFKEIEGIAFFIFNEDYRDHTYGIYSSSGKLIVPCKHEQISHIQADSRDIGRFFGHNTSPYSGACYSIDGKTLIANTNGIWNIKVKRYDDGSVRLIVNQEKGDNYYTGYASEDGNWIIQPHRYNSEKSDAKGVYYTYRTDEINEYYDLADFDGNVIIHNSVSSPDRIITQDNTVFYIIRKDLTRKLCGLLNEKLTEVVPCEYDLIKYIGGNYFAFKSNNLWGVFDSKIKVIIPTSRGYTSIGNYNSLEKVIPFTKPGYKGQCDITGKQISIIKDEDAKQTNVSSVQTTTKASSTETKSSTNSNILITTPVPVYQNTNNNTTISTTPASQPEYGNVQRDCPTCLGTGTCQTCLGRGWYYGSFTSDPITCPNCDSNHNGKCKTCHGSGKVTRYERLN